MRITHVATSALDAHHLRHRLKGTTLAHDLTLDATSGAQLRIAAQAITLVVYLFPGGATSPMHGTDTPLADAEEHRAFRDLHEQITALDVMVLGVSSQSTEKLQEAITVNRLCQPLASDPALRLAELLDLPTFPAGGGRAYERLTLIVTERKITQVFYPVPTSGRHADEVLEHITAKR